MTEDRDFGHSEWARERRRQKAAAIAAALDVEGIPASVVDTLPPRVRRQIERAAGVRESSPETWALAVHILEQGKPG